MILSFTHPEGHDQCLYNENQVSKRMHTKCIASKFHRHQSLQNDVPKTQRKPSDFMLRFQEAGMDMKNRISQNGMGY